MKFPLSSLGLFLVAPVLAQEEPTVPVEIELPALHATYSKGFQIPIGSNPSALKLNGLVQMRYYSNRLSEPSGGSSVDSSRNGFENTRTRLQLSGNAMESLDYTFQGEFGSSNGSSSLLDAYVTYQLNESFKVRAGQYRVPFNHEALVTPDKQLGVDRSLSNQALNLGKAGRSQGVSLIHSTERGTTTLSFSDGIGGLNGPWDDEGTDYAFTLRTEWLILGGSMDRFSDYATNGDDLAMMAGAGIHVQKTEHGTGVEAVKTTAVTLDMAIESGPYTLAIEGIYHDNRSASLETTPWGATVQAGLNLSEDTDAFARYTMGSDEVSKDYLGVLVVGGNRYFMGHNVKLTTDLSYSLNNVSSFWSGSADGLREDPDGDDGQLAFRVQLQLAF